MTAAATGSENVQDPSNMRVAVAATNHAVNVIAKFHVGLFNCIVPSSKIFRVKWNVTCWGAEEHVFRGTRRNGAAAPIMEPSLGVADAHVSNEKGDSRYSTVSGALESTKCNMGGRC